GGGGRRDCSRDPHDPGAGFHRMGASGSESLPPARRAVGASRPLRRHAFPRRRLVVPIRRGSDRSNLMNRRHPNGKRLPSFRPLVIPLEERSLPSLLPPVDYNMGTHPGVVAVGDFRGEGRPDLAVTADGSATVSVLLNQGNGSFQPAPDTPAGPSPVASV